MTNKVQITNCKLQITLFVVYIFLVSSNSFSQTDTSFTFRTIQNNAFTLGEKLVFDIDYGFITAGVATMEIPSIEMMKEQQCYKIVVRVHSAKGFDWIYTVRDSYFTYVDIQGIFPWQFEQHIREGGYRRDFIAEFDQQNHFATTRVSGDIEYIKIPEYVHDIVSAFYFCRTIDFLTMKPNDEIHLQNFYKDSTYALDVKYFGKEDIGVGAGEFRTLKIQPIIREGGLFKNSGNMTIWLSDDDNKIPVKMSSKIIIGSIVAELQQYGGIKNAMKAKK
jgi:hypothetical protein